MRLFSELGNKQGSKNTIQLLVLPLLLIALAQPQMALAMQLSFTAINQPELWQSAQSSITAAPVFTDTPTLPKDPHNTYDVNAWAGTAASPVTTPGNWPKKTPDVAWSPVTTTFTATTQVTPNIATGAAKLVLEGTASYYSRAGCLGCDPQVIMANGQPLRDEVPTMAIGAQLKQYVGYKARVTSLVTGKSIIVPITDTGGFYQAKYGYRVADLSVATKEAIGMKGGLGSVRVEVL